ncbi:MAG: signal peptidase I [bacterium]
MSENKGLKADNYDFMHHPQAEREVGPKAFFWEMLKVVVISLAIIFPVRYYIIQPFYVKGASMEPNFRDKEYLIVDEISYYIGEPKRGDVIVFHYPNDPKQFFIKRVIGLPGERIKVENGQIFISSDQKAESFKLLDEKNYLSDGVKTSLPPKGYSDTTLKEDQYFVLGDNRGASLDSRFFGPVDKKYIIGRTWLRGFPVDRFKIFTTPQYGL